MCYFQTNWLKNMAGKLCTAVSREVDYPAKLIIPQQQVNIRLPTVVL